MVAPSPDPTEGQPIAPKQSITSTSKMFSPEGELADVPTENLDKATKQGFKLAVHMTSPEGELALLHPNKAGPALAQGFKVGPPAQQPKDTQYLPKVKPATDEAKYPGKSSTDLPVDYSHPHFGNTEGGDTPGDLLVQGLQASRDRLVQKGGDVGAKVGTKVADTALNPGGSIPDDKLPPWEQKTRKVVRGVAAGTGRFVGGTVADPMTYGAFLLGGPTGRVAKTAISATFGVQAAKSASDTAGQLGEVWDRDDVSLEDKVSLGTESVMSALTSAGMLKHAGKIAITRSSPLLDQVPEEAKDALVMSVNRRISLGERAKGKAVQLLAGDSGSARPTTPAEGRASHAEVADHAADQGIELTPAQASQSKSLTAIQAVGERSLVGAKPLHDVLERQRGQVANAIQGYQSRVGNEYAPDAESVGEHLKSQATDKLQALKDKAQTDYQAFKDQTGGLGFDVDLDPVVQKYKTELQKQGEVLKNVPEQFAAPIRNLLEKVADIKSDLPQPEATPKVRMDTAQQLRSYYLEIARDRSGNIPSRVNRLAGQVAADLDEAMQQSAGPQADTWRRANATWKQLQETYNDKGSPLTKLISEADPQKITASVVAKGRFGGNSRTIKLMKVQGFDLSPVRQQVVSDLAQAGFKLSNGGNGLGGYQLPFLKEVFEPAQLDELLKLGRIVRATKFELNPSGTSNVLEALKQLSSVAKSKSPSLLGAGVGFGLGGPAGAALGAVGTEALAPALAAKFSSNPRNVARSLGRAPNPLLNSDVPEFLRSRILTGKDAPPVTAAADDTGLPMHGSGAASAEELGRNEKFWRIKRNGQLSYQGVQPDANLQDGEALVAVKPNGNMRVQDSRMGLGEQGVLDKYGAKVRQAANVPGPQDPDVTAAKSIQDAGLVDVDKRNGGEDVQRFSHPTKGTMFQVEDPNHPGKTMVKYGSALQTPESARQLMDAKLAEFDQAPSIDESNAKLRALKPEVTARATEEPISEKQPVFYSNLERTVQQKLPAKFSGDQALATLRNAGVKADELSVAEPFLKGQSQVSKSAFLDHVQANGLKVQDVWKVGEPAEEPSVLDLDDLEEQHQVRNDFLDGTRTKDETIVELARLGLADNTREAERLLSNRAHGLAELIEQQEQDLQRENDNEDGPRYSEHQLPGGENYRELLLQKLQGTILPKVGDNVSVSGKSGVVDKIKVFGSAYGPNRETSYYQVRFPTGAAKYVLATDLDNQQVPYQSSHWDEPNVLGHLRMNDRTDVHGKKTLFLEELQSDWHQQGRKHGYQEAAPMTDDDQKRLDQLSRLSFEERKDQQVQGEYENLLSREPGSDETLNKVPDAPFKKDWHELLLKRALREAAEGGYDQLAWTPGDVQNERYDLSTKIDDIRYFKDAHGNFHLDVNPISKSRFQLGPLTPEKLADHVGKDLASKMIQDGGLTSKVLKGDDLKIGGAGMRGFYDKLVPDFLNRYGKKWGVKVGSTGVPTDTLYPAEIGGMWIPSYKNTAKFVEPNSSLRFKTKAEAQRWIDTSEEKYIKQTIPIIPLTPKMRQDLLKGQPISDLKLPTKLPMQQRALSPRSEVQLPWA